MGSIGGLQTALTGLSVYGFAAMTKEVIDAGDAIYDTSIKLGIGTEQLGALQFAAEQMGSSTDGMNRSLGFLNKNIGLMQQGSQKATDAFGRLGLGAKDLVSLTLDQKFLRVATAMQQLGSETEQAAVAQQIFGKGGQEILPIIRAGTEAIIAAGAAAAASGSLFSEDQAAQMNNASDAIKEMTASWKGLRIELIEGFVPAMTFVMQEILVPMTRLFRMAQIGLKEMMLDSMKQAGADVSVEMEQIKRERARLTTDEGRGGPLASPAVVPLLKKIADNTSSGGDTIQLGTLQMR